MLLAFCEFMLFGFGSMMFEHDSSTTEKIICSLPFVMSIVAIFAIMWEG